MLRHSFVLQVGLLAALIALPTTAHGQGSPGLPKTAADLARQCDMSRGFFEFSDSGGPSCIAYIDGFVSAHAMIVGLRNIPPVFCLPSGGAPMSEMIGAFMGYVHSDPESLDKSARSELFIALRKRFPCA